MDGFEHVTVEVEDGVGIVTLNRPKVLNAMSAALTGELHEALAAFAGDDSVGCIVVTGAGEKAFSAGGDIHEQRHNDAHLTQAELDELRDVYTARCHDIAMSSKPTIGMMNGLAYGGAAVLASSLDMRIGCERTRFRFLAAAYGRINSTWTLPNQIGWPMAKELLFSARVVDADEAHRIGLLNHVVPSDQLRERTMTLAREIANNDTASIVGIKALMREQHNASMDAQWQAEVDYTRNVLRGARAEDAFPDFIARNGRSL
jgi:enoyl-CoA hydratase/carnithine racemase